MTLQTVTLSSLQPPTANPRTVFDATTLDGLAASIKTDGVLQNLLVAPVRGKGRYRIVSGERRFRALKLLEQRGDIDGDYQVPVEIRSGLSKDEVLRIATVENLQREDLPPLDQAVALASLIRKGTVLDEIVARTGLSATTIKRRLALNTLCGKAQEALRDGRLTLSHAEALTLGSEEAQALLLQEIESGHEVTADEIRNHFIDDRPSVAIAKFPLEQYTGTITTDLFQAAEESYFDDADQFMTLQKQAVDEIARSYEGKAAWVEVTGHYRIPEWQYDDAQDGQPAGVVINLSPRGDVEIREGLVRPEAIDADTADETADSPIAPVKPKAEYPVPLCRTIACHKTLAVQELLLSNARKAREVLAVDLLMRLRPHKALQGFVEHTEPQISYTVVDTQAALVARKLALVSDGSGWQTLASECLDDVDAYNAIKQLSDDDLDQLLTVLTVLPFGQDNCDRLDTGQTLFNAVARDLNADMRNHWRPDADFLNRRTRPQLAVIAKDCGFADGHSAVQSWKKGELVTAMLRYFEQARSASEPTPAQQKARVWLPDAMLFAAGGESPNADSSDVEDDA